MYADSPERGANRKRLGIAIGGAVAAVALVYGIGVGYFSSHFVPGATVGGVNASWLSAEQLAALVDQEVPSYSTRVVGFGADFTISAPDVALTVDSTSYASEALALYDARLWPFDAMARRSVNPELGVSFDEGLLDECVAQEVAAFNETAEPPTNATATYDAEQGAFVIVPDALGTQLDTAAVQQAVSQSLLELRGATALTNDQLLQPTITKDDEQLQEATAYANQAISNPIVITRDGSEVATADKDLLSDWVSVDSDDTGTHMVVSRGNIGNWVGENLGGLSGSDEVHDWQLDNAALATDLTAQVLEANGGTVEAPVNLTQTRPEESEGARERGRHIDVNLTTQYARLYDENGNVLWRSYIVSGNTAMGHGTPTGEFEINSMETGVVLSGLNDGVVLEEGEEPKPEDYYNSYVNYWMCFIGNDYGLHDATWRWDSEFGGDTYTYNGSHGCINLPYEQAEQLYNLVHVGDKVVVHW